MFITKQIVQDTITIAKLIVDKKIAGIKLQGESDPKSKIYHQQIKPKIEEFKGIHSSPPQSILNKFLDKYIDSHSLNSAYESSPHRFVGQILNAYAWACIINRQEVHTETKHMWTAQLYILINPEGIKFGFCYGSKIRNDDPLVEIVKSEQAIQNKIVQFLDENSTFRLFATGNPNTLPGKQTGLKIKNTTNIKENWSKEVNIIDYYQLTNIPEDIESQIEIRFNNLLDLYTAICGSNVTKQPLSANTWGDVEKDLRYEFYDKEIETEGLYFEDSVKKNMVNQINTALKNKKHIILIGPPGTGKSKLASLICETYCDDKYKMTTATSDWSTYETIGGYRPGSEDRQLEFKPGVILQCWQDFSNNPINKWLIIDEINRADIDKAFGSIFSALAGDNVTLPYEINGDEITIIGKPDDETEVKESNYIIHPDWRILATMNVFDKSSLYQMSYAFMRRFAFIPVEVPETPDSNLVKEYLKVWSLELSDEVVSNIADLWRKMNDKRKIGPAIVKDICSYVHSNPGDYGTPIILYIIPQLEGLPEKDCKELIETITQLPFMSNTAGIKSFASEFLGICW